MANIDLLHFENMFQRHNLCMLEVHLKICIFQPDKLCMLLLAYIFQDHKKERSMMLRRVNQQERIVLPDNLRMMPSRHQNISLHHKTYMTHHQHWNMFRRSIANTFYSEIHNNDPHHNLSK